MPFKQGDIVIVPFPYTNLSVAKTRPAIVVSNKLVNRGKDVILAQITSQKITGPNAFLISNSDVTVSFKPPYNTMYISCSKVAVIEKALIHKKISEIKEESIIIDILKKVKQNFEKE